MKQPVYICYNGEFFNEEEAVVKLSNRSFRYGDGLFESIRCFGTYPYHFEDHYHRLQRGMKLLQLESGEKLLPDRLKYYIERLLIKNKFFKAARLRLCVFRNDGGLYTPESSLASFAMECSQMDNEIYTLNSRGLMLGDYMEILKPVNQLSSIKSTSSLLFVLAAQYKKNRSFDDCIIYNEHKRIAETVSSNIFVVKGNNIFTPSLSEGCLDGVMRKIIIKLGKEIGFNVDDNARINSEFLLQADEVFITNAIQGIQWIIGYGEKRYYHKVSETLTDKLNEFSSFQDSQEN